jgi:hypothetical protein
VGAAVGILVLVAWIGGYFAYVSWLRKGLRTRTFESALPAEQLRLLFESKVASLGWKVVDHDNPMVAQSPLMAGVRQQIQLTMKRSNDRIQCEIKPVRIAVKGLARTPTKAHTVRMRLNAFEAAARSRPTGPATVGPLTAPPMPGPLSAGIAAPVAPPSPPVAATMAAPGPAATSPLDGIDHDGHTMNAAALAALRDQAVRPSFKVVIDDGSTHIVGGPTLVGRNPADDEGRQSGLIAVDDPQLSISKTHLALDIVNGALWVEDRHSTNGTQVIDPDGAISNLSGGEWSRVAPGSTIAFGDRSMKIGSA